MSKGKSPVNKKLAVASGKGGVGKSMVASALAMLFSEEKKVVAVDCDVDAPNLHLWLGLDESWDRVERISTNQKSAIDYSKCDLCGKCVGICAFGALSLESGRSKLDFNPYFCEGCGACEVVCPQKAIKLEAVENAEIRVRESGLDFPLISAQLYPGEVGSGKVVELIKQWANSFSHELMVLDSSAGTGCPVIATLKDVDFVVLVTEPTPSGFSDLQRVFSVVEFFSLPFGVIINKWDINPLQTEKMKRWAGKDFLGQISYDQKVFKAVASLTPILETDLKVKSELKEIFAKIRKLVDLKTQNSNVKSKS